VNALRLAVLLGVLVLAPPFGSASAQPVPVPETYGGDLLSRPKLTGSWGGVRDEMAKRGVVVDVDWYQVLQGVADGGRSTGFDYGGHADYTLNFDSGKARLWPGGFLRFHAETIYGTNVNRESGAIQVPNPLSLFPVPVDGGAETTVTNLTVMQFLAKWVGVFAGKIETLSGDENAFAHSYRDQFMNAGFAFNLTNALVPISSLGGGIVVVPAEWAVFTAMVVDPTGKPQNSGFGDFFQHGVTVASEGRVTIKPFGLLGHQTLGFSWSNEERTSLIQNPGNIFRALLSEKFPRLQDPGPILRRIIERRFPSLLQPVSPLNTESNTWNIYYNFDQFLWSPKGDPTRGIGPFFRFGVSDGDANPVKYHYNVGIGGKGVVPARPHDTFGVGWSRLELSDNFVPFLRDTLKLGLQREDVVEAYYNAALTGWLSATLDFQWIDPALKKELGSNDRLKDVDPAFVAGVRLGVKF
jgi:porin